MQIPAKSTMVASCRGWVTRAIFALVMLFIGHAALHAQVTNTNAVVTFQFSASTYSVDENTPGFINILVQRRGSISEDVTVEYEITDITALGGTDYLAPRGTLNFPAYTIGVVAIPIQIFDNAEVNSNKTFQVALRNPQGSTNVPAMLASPSNAVVTIYDDESLLSESAAGRVEIAPGNAFPPYNAGDYVMTSLEWLTRDIGQAGKEGLEVTIMRRGGAKGRILVDWIATTNNVEPTFELNIFDPFEPFFGPIFGRERGGGLARPGIDFFPTNGTVALDDFQMSTNVLLRIPNNLNTEVYTVEPYQEDEEYIEAAARKQIRPMTFGFFISNVRPAPEENPALIQPVLGARSMAKIQVAPDNYGFSFARAHYEAREDAGTVRIAVRRSHNFGEGVSVRYAVSPGALHSNGDGGDWVGNTFPLSPSSEYGTAFADYYPPFSTAWQEFMGNTESTETRLEWGDTLCGSARFANICALDFQIPIVDDQEVEFDEDLHLYLFKWADEEDGWVNQYMRSATLKILFDDQPAGAADRDFNRENDPLTDPPHNLRPGANNTVQAVVTLPNGSTVIGGDFTTYNNYNRSGIAKVLFNGQIDHSFNPGTGINGFIRAMAMQPDGKLVIGGGFSSYNNILRQNVARVNPNGSLDMTFNPGIGANGPVRAVALQPDGKVLIGGDFTEINGTNRFFLARLNADGSLDTSYDPGVGPDGPVYAIAISGQPYNINHQAFGGYAEDRFVVDTGTTEGTVTISYDFQDEADYLRIYQGGRLIFDTGYATGSQVVTVPYAGASTKLEVVVNEGSGAVGTFWLYNLIIHPVLDSQPVIGGNFLSYQGKPRNYIARLNEDGSLDESFDPGTGADGVVYALAKQGNKVIMGGAFHVVDLAPRNGIARLNADGRLDTEFTPGSGFNDVVYAINLAPDGKAVVGGLFTSFNGTRRISLARLNRNGSLDTGFMDTAYNQFAGLINPFSAENVLSQENPVLALGNYRITNITVNVTTNIDAGGVTNILSTTNVNMTEYVFVGGSFQRIGGGYRRDDVLNRLNYARVIGGHTPGPGNIEFMLPVYNASESGGRQYITLTRTNGSLAQASVVFSTSEPPAGPGVASAGQDYVSTNRTAIWMTRYRDDKQVHDALMGPNNNSFTTNRARGDVTLYTNYARPSVRYFNRGDDDIFVTLFEDSMIEGDEVLNMVLSSPRADLTLGGVPIPVGIALGVPQAQIIIADNDFNAGVFGLSSPTYAVSENEPGRVARITVTRQGGSTGQASVQYFTEDITAQAGLDYVSTFGTLSFGSGQVTNSFVIPLRDDTVAELDETLRIHLINPTGGARLDSTRTNAVLTLFDNDFAPGRISVANAEYSVSEDGGNVTVEVKRTGGNLGEITVVYSTADDSARSGRDYTAATGLLTWVNGETAIKRITIPIHDNQNVDASRSFLLVLSNPSVEGALGISTARVTINNNDSYGSLGFSQTFYYIDENGGFANITVLRSGGLSGEVSVDFLATNQVPPTAFHGLDFTATQGTLTFAAGESSKTFSIQIKDNNVVDGLKGIALSLSRPVRAGLGTNSNALLVIVDNESSNIPAGSVDTTFNQNQGTDGHIFAMALQPDGSLALGGNFTQINSIYRSRLARIYSDGTLDRTFEVGVGPNDAVRALALQPDGRLLVGGLFTTFNNTNRNHIVRLNVDGGVDITFNPGAGADNPINAVALQPDGKVLIGGSFSLFDGVTRNGIARLNTNGTLDVQFDIGTGANGAVNAIALQSDGKIVIGGEFTRVNGQPANRIARLNPDGSFDTSFRTGSGANKPVLALQLQTDRKILVGGIFDAFNGRPLSGIARLNPDGSVDEGFNPGQGANNAVFCIGLQIDGKILLGGDFTLFNGVTQTRITRLNSDGSVDPTINFGTGANGFVNYITVQPNRDILISGGFTSYNSLPRNYLARIHSGSVAGAGSLEFQPPVFQVDENKSDALITVRRVGGMTGTVQVDYFTSDGTAREGADYTAARGTLVFPQGESVRSFTVPIINDILVENAESVILSLTNFVGAARGGQPNATLVINSDDSVIGFSAPSYSVNENSSSASAIISVVRTGSTIGPASVTFTTLPGGSATAGVDYGPLTSVINFEHGVSNRTFSIPVYDDALVEGNEAVRMLLSSPMGANLGVASAELTISDNDFAPGVFAFTSAYTWANEDAGLAAVTVVRTNGTSKLVTVDFATVGGSATPGLDYHPTNGTLAFAEGEVVKTFYIPILNDFVQDDDETIDVRLSNATGGASVGVPALQTTTIVNNNYINGNIVFATNAYFVAENGTNVVITVERKNGMTGPVRVDYATSDGTAGNGSDYTGQSGSLIFEPGERAKTIVVPILNNPAVEGFETFNVTLANPQGGASLGRPFSTVVTVADDDLTLSFGAPDYAVREDEGSVTVTVDRSAGGPDSLTVDYITIDGSAKAGSDYGTLQGRLIFSAGELSKTIHVPIVNDTVIEGGEIFSISLTNATLGAMTSPIGTAAINILDEDGSLITTAGYALIQEGTNTANSTIDPGETVTIDLALQNIGRVNTTNLVATLLPRSGVASVSTPQDYGVLVAGGVLVTRPFTFTANGTNGGTITAVLSIRDGTMALGQVSFTFTLGSTVTRFANANEVSFPDQGPADPYPSTISVSGLSGTVSKLSVTVSGISHPYPDDIDLLLVSPTGQKALLMSDCGGQNAINNVTLTFDDNALATLSDAGRISSGTYRPSNYIQADLFPSPAPIGPYAETLSAFNNINPNGTWALFALDDDTGDAGRLVSGWSLTITTIKSLNETADLGVQLSELPETVLVGSNLTYTITVNNAGPLTATGVLLTNTLPRGLRFDSATVLGGSYIPYDGQVVISFPIVTNGLPVSALIKLTAVQAGAATNSVRLKGNEADLYPLNNIVQKVITIQGIVPPKIQSVARVNGSQFRLILNGQPGQNCAIQSSPDLNAWSDLITITFSESGSFTFTDTNSPVKTLYYRAASRP